MQTIGVTGALGLIGSTLIRKLNTRNVNVIPIDIRCGPLNPNGIDILDTSAIQQAINYCDGVIHLAAISRVIWGEENPALCTQVNVEGTRNIVDACLRAANKPWLIYASSREVYGQQDTFPVSETCVFKPHNHYAKSKMAAEKIVNAAKEAGLRSAIVRFSNVFGGFPDNTERVVPAFCLQALKHLPLHVNGADSLLDFTYVEDVVKGIIQTIAWLTLQNESLPAIHFVTGKATSLLELARLVTNLCHSESEIIVKPKDTLYPAKFYGDYTRAQSLLGWQPEHDVHSGIIKYLAQLRANSAALSHSNRVA